MFYYEEVGECITQVHQIEANTWEEAKQIAFKDMSVGDHIAMCMSDAVKQYNKYPEYTYIEETMCEEYATLESGGWFSDENGNEYWEENIYYFSDDPENYFNSKGEEFDGWK